MVWYHSLQLIHILLKGHSTKLTHEDHTLWGVGPILLKHLYYVFCGSGEGGSCKSFAIILRHPKNWLWHLWGVLGVEYRHPQISQISQNGHSWESGSVQRLGPYCPLLLWDASNAVMYNVWLWLYVRNKDTSKNEYCYLKLVFILSSGCQTVVCTGTKGQRQQVHWRLWRVVSTYFLISCILAVNIL